MKRIVILILILISFVSNAQFCKDYADKAVAQFKQAKKKNLPNINWPMWTDDWDGHYNWCKSVTKDTANKETAKRQAFLDKNINEDGLSVHLAIEALQESSSEIRKTQRQVNKNAGQNKYNAQQKAINAKKKKLKAEIDDFLNSTQKEPKQDPNAVSDYKIIEVTPLPDMTYLIGLKERVSNHYAKESVRQNDENISKGCGFNDVTWSSDYNAHKKWCMHGDNYLKAEKILADRKKQLKGCKEYQTIWIPGMVLGLKERESVNPNLNDPLLRYFLNKGINIIICTAKNGTDDTGYVFQAMSRGWYWLSIDKGNYANANQYKLPPGVVIGLSHTMDNIPVNIFGITSNIRDSNESIGNGNFHKECGGDFGSPAGEGLCWYESTGLNFKDWSQVDKLPRGTVIGLKHSINQHYKKLIWKDHVYDPVDPKIQPPAGFVRIVGGDLGAPAGEGYFWYEKITGK